VDALKGGPAAVDRSANKTGFAEDSDTGTEGMWRRPSPTNHALRDDTTE
jgi:hypothetical protein